jgi:predicted TIM-barrel fold metal-dependent hydrolase
MPHEYLPYLEERFQGDLASFVEESRKHSEDRAEAVLRAETKMESAEDALASGTYADVLDKDVRAMFATSLEKRLAALEADGFVGEVLFPDGSADNEIPFSGLFGGAGPYSAEQHHAALRAYNRWLGEHCAPGRQLGVALIPLDDPDYAVEEVQRVREMGLRGVYPEWDPVGPNSIDLFDPVYDRFWAACVDESLPVHFHVGAGVPSGLYERPSKESGLIFTFEAAFWARRALWHLIFGGVLERHPELKVTWVETRGDWLPRFLQGMDHQWNVWDFRLPGGIKEMAPQKPSEYWRRQCAITIPTPSLQELQARDEFPLETMMYGTDFPHAGSPWRVSNEYLQQTMGVAGFSVGEAKAFLGENAIRWYDLDAAELGKIAERVGPSASDVLDPDPASFEKLNAYMQSKVRRPADV